MANRTAVYAKTIHGTNPQYLIEKIIRTRIYESRYWKEDCFALNAELVVDKGADLRYVGGVYGGNTKPTQFMCLVLKLLQIQPELDVIFEFIKQNYFKYLRALGAFYLRLIGSSQQVYKYLEPLMKDFRKLRKIDRMGEFSLYHMDEFIDDLLHEDRVFDVILPRLTKRDILEANSELKPYVSEMEDALMPFSIKANTSPPRPPSPHPMTSNRSRSSSKKESRNHHHRDDRRDRDHDRHRQHHRDHRDRTDSRDNRDHHDRHDHRDRHDHHDRNEEHKTKRSDKLSEIDEANALRAKLGLKPLRQ